MRAGTLDRDGIDPEARLIPLQFLLLSHQRNLGETLLAPRPELVEVVWLRHALQLLRLHASAAVEEHALVHALECVQRLLSLGRRSVAAEPLLVDRARLVHDHRRQAYEARFVQARPYDKRLGKGRRHLPALHLAIVSGALPVDEILAFTERLHSLQPKRERHSLAGLVVDGSILVGLAVQDCGVKPAGIVRRKSHIDGKAPREAERRA